MLKHGDDYHDMLRELLRLRHKLLSLLAEQDAPPDEFARPFWDAHKLLVEGTEALKQATGYEEPPPDTGWIAYDSDD